MRRFVLYFLEQNYVFLIYNEYEALAFRPTPGSLTVIRLDFLIKNLNDRPCCRAYFTYDSEPPSQQSVGLAPDSSPLRPRERLHGQQGAKRSAAPGNNLGQPDLGSAPLAQCANKEHKSVIHAATLQPAEPARPAVKRGQPTLPAPPRRSHARLKVRCMATET
jgi:hypothetical protein